MTLKNQGNKRAMTFNSAKPNKGTTGMEDPLGNEPKWKKEFREVGNSLKMLEKIHPRAKELQEGWGALNPGLFIGLEQKELHWEQKGAQLGEKQSLGDAAGMGESRKGKAGRVKEKTLRCRRDPGKFWVTPG